MPTTSELLNLAIRHHQGGNFAQAEPLYRHILQAEPANAEALHMLGLLAHQTDRHEAAAGLLRQAAALNPLSEGILVNLGIVLMSQRQFGQAAASFQSALQLKPGNAEAHINLGNAYYSQGQLAGAADCYRQAVRLNPSHAEAQINLGNALMNLKQFDDAIASYRAALRLKPGHPHALNNLGNAFMGQGKLDEADSTFRQALAIDPGNSKAHYNLGLVLKEQGRMVQAAACFRQAVRWQPSHADALNNLGIILREQGHLVQAVECYRNALRVTPDNADVLNNLGNALKDQGLFEESLACFEQALRHRPTFADALNNMGLAFKDQGRFQEAGQAFQNAIALEPGHHLALWNRCLLNLLHGDFAAGWPDHEQRWFQQGVVPRTFKEPRWDGSPLHGKTILVFAEMGLGDTIHFLRFLPAVKRLGGTVVLECQPALINLFAGYPGADVVVAVGKPLPAFDVQIPLLSLPSVFGTTLDTIPNDSPYLRSDPQHVEKWRHCLFSGEPKATTELTIGIAWHANPKHTGFNHKSFPLRCFGPLSQAPNIRLVSLQVGPETQQLAQTNFSVTDLGSRFDPDSLEDLAGAMMSLDLIVTVDTGVAHLAGALGVPVWVALPFVACWRWLRDREDSPWYPTMRLFRQRKLNDWDDVFQRIAAALRVFQLGSANRH
jgi:tetratricopeptide (TPR) repeat protein